MERNNTAEIIGMWLADKACLNASEYEIVYELEKETPLYYAFNKNISDSTVDCENP